MKTIAITSIFTLFSIICFAQDKLFIPNNTSYPTAGPDGIGINEDRPEAALHIVESDDQGTALRIDLKALQYQDQGGSWVYTVPEYAFRVKNYEWGVFPEKNIFSIDAEGKTRILYDGNTGGEALSVGYSMGIFNNNSNKLNLKYSGSQPEFTWTTSSSKNLKFRNTNNNKTPLTLSPNGKVGINTEDFIDDHDLYVNGSVYIKGDSPETYSIYIEGTGVAEELDILLKGDWGDFVFQDDYPLLPLNELQDFIDKNGHLPEMPTAEKVANDGLQTGETIRLLNIKVEELTLYLLQQQKEIEALKAKIKD